MDAEDFISGFADAEYYPVPRNPRDPDQAGDALA